MNEQIMRLAEQAELNTTLFFNKEKLEKFAEIIIRECIAIASIKESEYKALKKSAYDFEEKEIYAEAACAAEQIQNEIKGYFGV